VKKSLLQPATNIPVPKFFPAIIIAECVHGLHIKLIWFKINPFFMKCHKNIAKFVIYDSGHNKFTKPESFQPFNPTASFSLDYS